MLDFIHVIRILLLSFIVFWFSNSIHGQTQSCEIPPGLFNEFGFPEQVNFRTFDAGNSNAMVEGGFFHKCSGEIGGRIQIHTVSTEDPNAGWDIDIALNGGTDWDNWSNQGFPTSYRDDTEIVDEEYLNWTYYLITDGTLKGWGNWEESELSVVHSPINFYYAMEVGEKANGHNSGVGVRVWMSHEGTLYNPDLQVVIEDASVLSSLYLDLGECIDVDEHIALPNLSQTILPFCTLEDVVLDEIIPSENNLISVEQINGCDAQLFIQEGEPIVISNLQIGTNTFLVQNEDLCGNVQEEEYTILVTACPGDEVLCAPFSAGPDKFFVDCGEEVSLDLQAEVACALNGTWQVFSGGGVIENFNDPNSGYNPEIGLNVLVWNTFCNGNFLTDTVEIEVVESELYTMSTGGDASIYLCDEFTFSLDGNILPSTAAPFWVQESGPPISFSNPLDPNAEILFTVPGEYVIRWQYIDPCGNYMFSSQTIEILEDVLTTAISCNSTTELMAVPSSYDINGLSLGGIYEGEWSVESESLLIIEDESEAQTSVSALTYGTHIFNWEITNAFCLSSLTCSDTLVITNPDLSGCTLSYATNYSSLAEEDDGSCEFDFSICDCDGNNHSPYVTLRLGDGIPDDESVNFNCETWGYDCGDIIDAPISDPHLVCEGNLPPLSGCICSFSELSSALGESFISIDSTLVDPEVCYNTVELTPNFSGGCFIHELCFKIGQSEFVCMNLPAMNSYYFTGEVIEFQTTADAQWMDFYVTAQSMVSDTVSIYVPPCTTNVEEISKDTFQIFPNPTKGILKLVNSSNKQKELLVHLTDGIGRVVFSEGRDFNTQLELDLSALPNGIYFLHIFEDETLLQREKIIIQNQ